MDLPMVIAYGEIPLLLAPDEQTVPKLKGTLIALNGCTVIQKESGMIASMDPSGKWTEVDPSTVVSAEHNVDENCLIDESTSSFTIRTWRGVAYRVAFHG